MSYMAGDRFVCRSCGCDSVVEERKCVQGWDVVGAERVCAMCGAALPPEVSAQSDPSTHAESPAAEDERRNAALALFGAEEDGGPNDASQIFGDAEQFRFCRDCFHYLPHPFGARCAVWEKSVEPMQDCDSFQRKNPSE